MTVNRISAAKRRQHIAAGVSPQIAETRTRKPRSGDSNRRLLPPLRGSRRVSQSPTVGSRPRLCAVAASRLKTAKPLAHFYRRSIASALVLMLLCGLLRPAWSQAPAPEPAESGPEKANPRTVVEAYFNALKNGDFDAANAVVNIELKRKDFEENRTRYGDQKRVVSTALQSHTGHRACVVTDKIQWKFNDVFPPAEVRLVVQLDDTRGRWLIRSILHTGNQAATNAIVEFKRKYTDAIEIAPPKPATVSAKRNPRETAETFFKALITGDLKSIAAVLVADEEQITQKALDMVITGLGDQKLTVATVLIAQKKGRALVISEPFRITLSGEDPPPIGRYILDLSDGSGQWRIHDLVFDSLERAAEAEAGFRKQHADAKEIPVPEVTPAKPKRKLTVFKIEHADAMAVSAILDELFDEFSIVVDERTSRLFVRFDDEEAIEELSEVLRLLDQSKKDDEKKTDGPAAGQPGRLNTINLPPGGTQLDVQAIYKQLESEVDAEYVAEVRAGATQAEAESLAKAGWIRSQLKEADDPDRRAEFRRQLRNLVETSFMGRLSLQKSELALLRNKLAGIESQIQSREKLRERIIDRRVEELLDPELHWESPPGLPTAGGVNSGNRNPLPGILGGPAGVTQSQSPQALVQSGGGSGTGTPIAGGKQMKIQFHVTRPQEMRLHWDGGKQTIVVPGRAEAFSGQKVGFSLTNISGREGLQLYGSVEVPPLKQTETFLKHNAVPLEFTDEDFDQVTSGNLVTKVLLLPNPEFQELAIAGVETLVSTRLDPGVDPLTEAQRRGAVLAILRLGNRIPAGNSNGKVTSLNSEFENESQLIQATTILFFHTEQCAICKKVEPDFNKAVSELGLPSIRIDGVKHPEIAKRFRVTATPTFVLLLLGRERGRVTGAEFQPLVDRLKEYWEDLHGPERGQLTTREGGLKAFLTRELAEAQRSRESVLTDVIAQELVVAELGPPVELRPDLTKEQREQIEKENKHRQREQERVAGLKVEMKPYDAKIELIRKRLKELESSDGFDGLSRKPDASDSVVWIEGDRRKGGAQ
jgi:thiol-disulfide isomerase/thioredoxin